MGFVKVVKNSSYFKRFQVKYRRRREGKTDYRARLRLIKQDKTKYNTPKYRLVVRKTNKDIITHLVYAKISGDVVVESAYARELKNYGLKVGFTNYASAYATGLLIARRILNHYKLDSKYQGLAVANGEEFSVKWNEEGPRPFKALLDVGLARTTTGARVFAVLKGTLDGGLFIPHKDTRFAGYNKETKQLEPAKLRKYIFAGHVADYMKKLNDKDKEKYNKHFSQYIKAGVKSGDLEKIYKDLHAAIRKDPTRKKQNKKPTPEQVAKYKNNKKLTLAQRKERVKAKLTQLRSQVGKKWANPFYTI